MSRLVFHGEPTDWMVSSSNDWRPPSITIAPLVTIGAMPTNLEKKMTNLIDPVLVPIVNSAKLGTVKTPVGKFAFISALGTVPTSGWSGVALSPVYYVKPPEDGILDIDFVADPPSGHVLPIDLPVSATILEPAPDWLKGIRIRAAKNEVVESDTFVSAMSQQDDDFATKVHNKQLESYSTRAIVSKEIAVYDDSFQPIGFCSGFPPKVKMKKLRHRLTLKIEGPDEGKIRRCINEALAAGLIAAIIAAFVTGGAALSAAIAALKSYLISCLGASFSVRVDRSSHWITWCT